ncbi:MAG: hypothetical protein JXX14_22580 [Deltaproteobacteria bacterium]|nr:hypothetical protein [Deltaproteobacteria bacterium]
MMKSDQVFLSMVVNQLNGYSYETLWLHLQDSKSYSPFAEHNGLLQPLAHRHGFGLIGYPPCSDWLHTFVMTIEQ